MDEWDEVFDADWNEAVDNFEGGENDEEFQDRLRGMVRDLQRLAFQRGIDFERDTGGEGLPMIAATLDVDNSRRIIYALLNDRPVTIKINGFA